MNKTVGDNIRKRREAMRLSRRELAELANFAEGTVYDIETGVHYPGLYSLCRLCLVFKCTINDLIPEAIYSEV